MNRRVVFLFFLTVVPLLAQDSGPEISDSNAGFSYNAPADWSLQRVANLKYPVAVGLPVQGFKPNINVVETDFSGSLQDYVEQNKKVFQSAFPKSSERSESKFITDSGLKGIKWVVKDTQEKEPLRQILYFFAGHPGEMLVVTCTTLSDDGQNNEAFFDAAIKTFRVQ